MIVEKLASPGWVVWGASTLEEAAAAVVQDAESWDWMPLDEEFDHDVEPEFEIVMSGLMRKNVQAPGGEYGWALGYARHAGHGARQAILLEFAGWKEVEYAA